MPVRNCFNETPKQFGCWFAWDDEGIVNECPNSYFDNDELQFYLSIYGLWKLDGQTPWGNLFDCPGPVYQALIVLQEAMQELQNQKEDQERRRMERESKKVRQGHGRR